MFVLGLDLETTGLDPQTDEIIEIGAVIWDTERKLPLKIYSELVLASKSLPPEITQITGIAEQDLIEWGISLQEAMFNLESLARSCSHIVAHNGKEFDQIFIQRALQRYPEIEFDLPWIDTLTDLPFPQHLKTRKLSYLAAEHGFLNPFAHRSLFDVLTMMKVFSQYSTEEIMAFSQSPMLRIVAQVSFEDREKAKSCGFRWDPNRKQWFTSLREIQFSSIEFPFPTTCELL